MRFRINEHTKTGKMNGWHLIFFLAILVPVFCFAFIPSSLAATGPEVSGLVSSTHPIAGSWYPVSDLSFNWHTMGINMAGFYDSPGNATTGVAIRGQYAYVADGTAGLQILDLTDPAAPVLTGSIDTPGGAFAVAVQDDFAYVADSSAGLQVIDVSNPASPSLRASFDTLGKAQGVAVMDQYLYLGDGTSGLKVFDIHDPVAPVLKRSIDTPGTAGGKGVAAAGNYVYLADGNAGIQIFDASEQANPVLAATYNTPDSAETVALMEDYAYVADSASGLQILNVSNPAAPVLAGSYDTPDKVRGVALIRGLAFVADNSLGLKVINVENPAAPVLVSSFDTAGNAYAVAVSDTHACVADTHAYADKGGLYTYNMFDKSPAGYSYILDQNPATVPDTITEGEGENASYTGMADGAWYFHVRAKDDSDSWGPASHRRAGIDTALPSTDITVPAGWQNQDVDVGLSCSDATSGCKTIHLNINGAVHDINAASAVYTINEDGEYSVAYYAEDFAGNAEAEQTAEVRLDKTAPSITNITATGSMNGENAEVQADLSDNLSGVDSSTATISIDGQAPLTDCTISDTHISCNETGLTPGNHTISVGVRDVAGNLATAPDLFNFFDHDPPTTTDDAPAGWLNHDFTVNFSCTDTESGCREIRYQIDGGGFQHVNGAAAAYSINTEGDHAIVYGGKDYSNNLEEDKTVHARLDKSAPSIYDIHPNGSASANASVGAYVSDALSGIDNASAYVYLDGQAPLSGCSVTDSYLDCPAGILSSGEHTMYIRISDNAGNNAAVSGYFQASRDYYWTWYDSRNMNSWIMAANPAGAAKELEFDLSIAGIPYGMPNVGMGPGVVPAGMSLGSKYDGMMDGPVKVASLGGEKAVVSQRSLMGDSFEEVLGTDAEKLSDHFYWSWYDMKSAGFQNWILISNPGHEKVRAEIRIGGELMLDTAAGNQYYFEIEPGKNVTPTFPGKMAGPVEVIAYRAGGSWPADARDVMASQRVLSNHGTAFNEVPGIPANELSSDYIWTWYDMKTSGYQNWIILANPGDTEVSYDLKIAGAAQYINNAGGQQYCSEATPCSIAPHERVALTFPGTMNGPVEVSSDSDIIASQRVIAGPSFEEVPGYPKDALNSTYHWTWYDMQSPGSANWILISNPGDSPVDYTIEIPGLSPGAPGTGGTIAPHSNVTPLFPGTMNGPLKVTSTGGVVMVSQRVSWNGHFNEVLGTVLD